VLKHISLGIAADSSLLNQFKIQHFDDSQNFKAMWDRTKLQQYINYMIQLGHAKSSEPATICVLASAPMQQQATARPFLR
jgi:hypothetical protein